MTDIRDDISYMRRLAEQGRRGPILGGTFLTAAGLVFGATCLIHWAAVTGRIPFPETQLGNLWWGACALFAIVWFALFFRMRSKGQVKSSASNAAFGLAWSACGVGIIVSAASVSITASVLHSAEIQIVSTWLAFVFYGTAWTISAAVARRWWMLGAAIAAFATAPLLALLSGDPRQLLAMAFAILITLCLPGFKLMADESK
ncbi:MAG: hypothetical protein KGJ78_01900 [Alphaproteobacteria bacterium]|nr:hypothetical protein [Alphaproteobacteria bacterium]